MPTTINVILQQDVHNLGKTGEVVRVRPGFARNFLLPKSIAAAATSKNVSRIEHEKKAAASRNAKLKIAAEELAKKIAETPVTLARKAGEGDKLYGAVTSTEIAHALAEKGVQIDRRKIVLPEAIKTVGTFELPVKLGYDVIATVKVEVTKR